MNRAGAPSPGVRSIVVSTMSLNDSEASQLAAPAVCAEAASPARAMIAGKRCSVMPVCGREGPESRQTRGFRHPAFPGGA